MSKRCESEGPDENGYEHKYRDHDEYRESGTEKTSTCDDLLGL